VPNNRIVVDDQDTLHHNDTSPTCNVEVEQSEQNERRRCERTGPMIGCPQFSGPPAIPVECPRLLLVGMCRGPFASANLDPWLNWSATAHTPILVVPFDDSSLMKGVRVQGCLNKLCPEQIRVFLAAEYVSSMAPICGTTCQNRCASKDQ